MASFAQGLAAWCKKTGQTLEDGTARLCLDLTTSIITATPVDKGTARANWQATIGAPASGVLPVLPDGSASGAAQKAIAAAVDATLRAPGQVFYLTNNLPYIGRLEYDAWSDLAPGGMVRPALAKARAKLAGYYTRAGGK